MQYNMIRYNTIPEGIEWVVIRKGRIVASGIDISIDSAKINAEKAIIDAFKADILQNKVLLGHGNNQLSLIGTDK